MAARPGRPSVGSLPGFFSRANDKRLRGRYRPGLTRRRPARVTVTLTSRTQGNALTALTDAGGRFVFPIVRPDTYTLQAALQGFKTLERTNLVVNANDKLSTGR